MHRNNKKRMYNQNMCPTGAADHFIHVIYSHSRTIYIQEFGIQSLRVKCDKSARYLICLMYVVFEPVLCTIDRFCSQQALLLLLNLSDKCSAAKSKMFPLT